MRGLRLGENLSRQNKARGAAPIFPLGPRWGQLPQTRIMERIAKAPPLLGSRGEAPGLIITIWNFPAIPFRAGDTPEQINVRRYSATLISTLNAS